MSTKNYLVDGLNLFGVEAPAEATIDELYGMLKRARKEGGVPEIDPVDAEYDFVTAKEAELAVMRPEAKDAEEVALETEAPKGKHVVTMLTTVKHDYTYFRKGKVVMVDKETHKLFKQNGFVA